MAALVIFRTALQWKAFQAERTPLFDRIINTMGQQVGSKEQGRQQLCAWMHGRWFRRCTALRLSSSLNPKTLEA